MAGASTVSGVKVEPGAERALKKLHRSDPRTAQRVQGLVDEVIKGATPQGSSRMNCGSAARKAFGTVPWKASAGKLRLIFVPGERIIALGYRRDVYTAFGVNGWAN
jgi:hypothetical protein